MGLAATDVDADVRASIRSLWSGRAHPNQRFVCPACSPSRKSAHRFDRTLSLREDGGVLLFNCHHCGIGGGIRMSEALGFTPYPVAGRTHTPPISRPVEEPAPASLAVVEAPQSVPDANDLDASSSPPALTWLRDERHISLDTLRACGVGLLPWTFHVHGGREQREAIVFPYKTGGKTYAQKLRTFPDKMFSQRGAACTFWNEGNVRAGDDLVIVEGELDALAVTEAGHASVVSAPNGAPSQVSDRTKTPEEDRKFQYVYAGREMIAQAKRVIIAGDRDPQGEALQEELARRIGKGKCWRVTWPDDCKDANDTLIKHGKQAVLDAIAGAQPWPVKGVYDVAHYRDRLEALYQNGVGKGASTGFSNVDEHYSVVPGHLTVVTGTPGSGKTSWVNQLLVNLAQSEGWSFALFSTEITPDMHIAELSSLYLGKPFFDGPTPRMTKAELEQAARWVQDHFCFIELEGVAELEDIVEKLSIAVMRYGIRGFVVDPASYIRKRSAEGQDSEWAGVVLDTFKAFARNHDCAAWCIAHPYKMRRAEDGSSSSAVPKGYDISGSAHWYNRPDFGLTVHRPADARHMTEIHVWKVRFRWTGSEGSAELFYDLPTGRYSENPFMSGAGQVIYSFGAGDEEQDPWAM